MTPPAATFGAGGEVFAQATGGADAMAKAAEKQAKAIEQVVSSLQLEIENLGMSNEVQKLNTDLRRAGVDLLSPEGQKISELVSIWAQRTAQVKAAAEAERLHNQEIETGVRLAERLAPPTEKYAADIEALTAALAAAKISQQAYDEATAQAVEDLDLHDKAMQEAKKSQEEFNRVLDEAGTKLQDDLVAAFTESANAAEAWHRALTAIIKDVGKMIEDLLSQALGLNQSGGGLGGLFSALGSSLFGTSLTSQAAADVATLPFFQSGGQIGAGDWAVVGEAGPELIQANQPSTVFPNHMLGSSGGGGAGGHVAYIDARGADPASVARMEAGLRELHYSIEKRAIAAVERDRRRGGQLARTFGR
jgi:hypothetical protein